MARKLLLRAQCCLPSQAARENRNRQDSEAAPLFHRLPSGGFSDIREKLQDRVDQEPASNNLPMPSSAVTKAKLESRDEIMKDLDRAEELRDSLKPNNQDRSREITVNGNFINCRKDAEITIRPTSGVEAFDVKNVRNLSITGSSLVVDVDCGKIDLPDEVPRRIRITGKWNSVRMDREVVHQGNGAISFEIKGKGNSVDLGDGMSYGGDGTIVIDIKGHGNSVHLYDAQLRKAEGTVTVLFGGCLAGVRPPRNEVIHIPTAMSREQISSLVRRK